MTENALSCRRENLVEGEQQLSRDIVKELSEEKKKILIDYFEKISMIADHECAYLYVQEAKD